MDNLISFIDPEWIYIASVSDAANTLCAISAFATIVWCIIYAFGSWGTHDFKGSFNVVFLSIVILIVFIAGSVFLPSQDTLLNMKIAEFVNARSTAQTIDSVSNQLKEVIRIMSGG